MCVWLLQISTSFGNMDPFGTGQTLPPLQLPQPTAPSATHTQIKKPPKWIIRPVGASFAVSVVSYEILYRAFYLSDKLKQIFLPFLSFLVWWEAGFFRESKAKPSTTSAARSSRCPHQPSCYRNRLFEAVRPTAGHSERRNLCGLLPGKDWCC